MLRVLAAAQLGARSGGRSSPAAVALHAVTSGGGASLLAALLHGGLAPGGGGGTAGGGTAPGEDAEEEEAVEEEGAGYGEALMSLVGALAGHSGGLQALADGGLVPAALPLLRDPSPRRAGVLVAALRVLESFVEHRCVGPRFCLATFGLREELREARLGR